MATTPEQLDGMNPGAAKFISLSDVSDSEAEMDLDSGDEDASDDEDRPPAKRVRATTEDKADDGNAAPRWSNPDPYTALPPPDETHAKRRDFVKLIRKAKVAPEHDAAASNAVTKNDDFISLNFDDDEDQQNSDDDERPRAMKRAYQDDDDDDLESLPPPPKSKKRKREVIDGRVVEDWRPRAETPRAPWCTSDHSGSANMSTWLHKEISDFYDYVKPHPFEDEIRRDLVKRIERSLQIAFHGSELHCFGSFAAGLYLPTADMDLVLLSKQFFRNGQGSFQKKDLYKVSSVLERDGISQPGATEVVAKARVPIVKLVDRVTGLKVDISFDNQTGIVANKTFQEWKKIYSAMPVIATLVKQFLAMRGLNEVYTGGLGGFSVICLVVSLIHTMPVRQSNNHTADSDFGELLLNFFDLYGNKFNLNTTRISLNPIEYVVKGSWDLNGKPTRADRLSIIDPNTANNDISSGSHNVVLIQRCFRDAFKELQRRMSQLKACAPLERKNESILSVLFAGDYSSFQWQRNRLRKIFESNRYRKWATKAAHEMTVPKLAELFTGNREKPVYVSKNDEKMITQYWPMKLYGTNKPVLNV
ncbi:hypothetical protein SLS56_011317 [Neofusicoccum ribis]|uniref:polynucleotide adenylyltransferase n=1 Tax=Neofusicoccum ribis TaxID=45134 RepID=A0ABR3SC22_9PEZI